MIDLRKGLLALLLCMGLASSALAQGWPPVPLGPSGGGGGGGGGGSGTVTSVATSCGVSGGPITTTGTIVGAVATNPVVTGSAYTFLASDCGKLVIFSDGTARAPSLPSASFVAGNFINVVNTGAGAETITPTTGTIGGAATLVLQQGQGVGIAFDGTNWQITGGPYARGPASATNGHIATFNGATGQLLQDGGAPATGTVTGPGSSVSGNLPSFNGTGGQTLQDSGIAPPTPPPAPNSVTQTQLYVLFPTVTLIGTTAPSQNTARCSPFFVAIAQHWDELAIGVTTLGTGPITVALYTDAIDSTTHIHQPQTLITNSSGSFTVTGTGLVTSAMGVAGTGIPIPAGLNWVCTNDVNSADAVRLDIISGTSTYYMNLVGSIGTGNVTSLAGISQFQSMIKTSVTSGTWNSFVGVTFNGSDASTGAPIILYRPVSVP